MTSTKQRSNRGRKPKFPTLRKEIIAALKKLREPGKRKRGKGGRGAAKKWISNEQIRKELPVPMQKVNDKMMKAAAKGLKRHWKHPWKPKNQPISGSQWNGLILCSQNW